jgi:hypothetical protein
MEDTLPDLVLIDGRFRVCCALTTLLKLKDRKFKLLFDDYMDRPHYNSVERFSRVKSTHGRMVELEAIPFDEAELRQAIDLAAADWQ